MGRAPEFLNVDLDVVGGDDLKPLAEALEALGAFTLHCGGADGAFRASFEVSEETVERTIVALAQKVEQLPPPARSLWDRAVQRDFNLGIEAGTDPQPYEAYIGPDVLRVIAGLGARLGVTVYPASDEGEPAT